MSSSSIKNELADHIYQYLCHEAQYSDLPEAARESLTAASECIEQAYKLNSNQTYPTTNNTNNHNSSNTTNTGNKQHSGNIITDCLGGTKSYDILPDELLRIFTRHKEFLLAQQLDSLKSPLMINENDTCSSLDKPDIRLNNNPLTGTSSNFNSDSHNNSNPINNNNNTAASLNTNTNTNNATTATNTSKFATNTSSGAGGASNAQQPQASTSKPLSQHPISQLPMTTRKKLSHLRAQIKRQASKAARSRLEKRSSVSGVATTGSGGDKGANLGFGVSLDASPAVANTKNHQAGDGYNGHHHHHHHHHHHQLHNQPNSSSSTESPNAYSSSVTNNNNNNQSTSSPATGGQSASHNQQQTGNSNQDGSTSANLSPGQHNESGAHPNSGTGTGGGGHLPAPSSGHHRHSSKEFGVSVHQKNFKQKLIALLKKFRTDGSDFDSEEQYREALERELIKAAAGRGSRAIEELLEEEIDVEEESGSELEDWDNISETSTPKPSLRPFFSSTTLDKI